MQGLEAVINKRELKWFRSLVRKQVYPLAYTVPARSQGAFSRKRGSDSSRMKEIDIRKQARRRALHLNPMRWLRNCHGSCRRHNKEPRLSLISMLCMGEPVLYPRQGFKLYDGHLNHHTYGRTQRPDTLRITVTNVRERRHWCAEKVCIIQAR